MFAVKHVTDSKGNVIIQDPPVAQFLFSNSKASVLWLIVRLYIGWQWIEAGWHKFEDPAWMQTGDGILGFWNRALAVNNGKPVIAYDWYRNFIQFLVDSGSHPWFAKLIVFGELAVGLGLIVGALVGVAAFFGALMNMSFLMAGTVSTNPVLFLAGILLILAWKNAGYIGIDRFLLPMLGTPWKQREAEVPAQIPGAARTV
ncbi:MAG: DoxX family protein [Chloroflexi bacterium]|nr:DoxX family protein [Chloroflexota bacterium]